MVIRFKNVVANEMMNIKKKTKVISDLIPQDIQFQWLQVDMDKCIYSYT